MFDVNDFRVVVVDWVKEPVLLCTHEYFNYLKDIEDNHNNTFTVTDDTKDKVNYFKIREYIEKELCQLYGVSLVDVKFHQDSYGEIDNVKYFLIVKDTSDFTVDKIKSLLSFNVLNFCNRYGLAMEFYNVEFIID